MQLLPAAIKLGETNLAARRKAKPECSALCSHCLGASLKQKSK